MKYIAILLTDSGDTWYIIFILFECWHFFKLYSLQAWCVVRPTFIQLLFVLISRKSALNVGYYLLNSEPTGHCIQATKPTKGCRAVACHNGRPGSIPGQSFNDFLWTKWQLEHVFTPVLVLCHSNYQCFILFNSPIKNVFSEKLTPSLNDTFKGTARSHASAKSSYVYLFSFCSFKWQWNCTQHAGSFTVLSACRPITGTG